MWPVNISFSKLKLEQWLLHNILFDVFRQEKKRCVGGDNDVFHSQAYLLVPLG